MGFDRIKFPEGDLIQLGTDGRTLVSDHPLVGFIEGDGIGPDIMRASKAAWDAAVKVAYDGAREIRWCELFAGEKANRVYGRELWLPEETLEALKLLRVAVKGPLTTPVGGGFRSLNVALRQELDLYACVRPVRYFPGVPSPVKHPELTDMVFSRKTTMSVSSGCFTGDGTPGK